MGLVKKVIPTRAKPAVKRFLREKIPEGFVQNHMADFATGGGAVLVAAGAKVGGRFGMLLRTVGHFGDDVDGDLARFYGVAGGIGGKIGDVLADRFKLFIEAKKAWEGVRQLQGEARTGRQIVVGAIATKAATITTLNGIAMIRGRDAESLKWGKRNFYADSLTLGFFGWADASHTTAARRTHTTLGYTMFSAGLVTGGMALRDYGDIAFGAMPSPEVIIETTASEGVTPPAVISILGPHA